MKESRIVESFDRVDFSELELPSFVIYQQPTDFPDKFVVRLFDFDRPTNIIMLFDTIDQARGAVPDHFVAVTRSRGDDPVIVETYI